MWMDNSALFWESAWLACFSLIQPRLWIGLLWMQCLSGYILETRISDKQSIYMVLLCFQKILPGGNTSFDVVFLARMVGNVENTLFINTSNHGVFTYQVRVQFWYFLKQLRIEKKSLCVLTEHLLWTMIACFTGQPFSWKTKFLELHVYDLQLFSLFLLSWAGVAHRLKCHSVYRIQWSKMEAVKNHFHTLKCTNYV